MNLNRLTEQSRLLFLSVFLQIFVSITVSAQTITVDFTDTPLKEVLVEIAKQSGYNFVYSSDVIDVNQKVTLYGQTSVMTIDQLLDKLFSDLPVSYQIQKRQIVLKLLPQPRKTSIENKFFGKITDEAGEPLAGVTVKNETTGTLTVSDIDGNYSVEAKESDRLSFSLIGMETWYTIAGKSAVINVPMKIDVIALGDVVVTGYQTISKERNAGSFSLVKGSEIKDKANLTGTVLGSFEGLATGFNVNNSSDGDKYLIRGVTSVNSTRKPLFVVDGVPLSSDAIEELVNNNDIESVTFLKDATAASIWGAQAANGVVVMSTKRGIKEKKIQIAYDGSFTYKGKPVYNYQNMMDSETFIKNAKEVFDSESYPFIGVTSTIAGLPSGYRNAVIFPHEMPMYKYINGEISLSERDTELSLLSALNSRDQYEKYFMSNSYFTNHALSFTGGGEKYTYYGSMSYKGDQGISKDYTDKYAINLRQNLDLTNWLAIDLTINASVNKMKANVIPSNISTLPYMMYTDVSGSQLSQTDTKLYSEIRENAESISGIDLGFYPLSDFNNSFTKSNGMNLRTNAGVTIKLLKGLKYEGRFQYFKSYSKAIKYLNYDVYSVRYERVVATDNAGKQYLPSKGGHFTKSDTHETDWTIRNQLSYDKNWNNSTHQLTALAGIEIRDNTNSSFYNFIRGYDYQTMTYELYDMKSLATTGIANPLILNSSSGAKNVIASNYFSENEIKYRFVSYYANGSYTFHKKYVLNGSIRVDQSNLFGTSTRNQFKPIWSLGAAWHVKDEKFLSEYGKLNRLTLRISYGINGNSPDPGLGGPYDILDAYTSSMYPAIGYTIATPANDKLSWERTSVSNIGVDFGFYNGRISGSIDIYSKKTTDLLGQVLLNSVTGWASALGNLGIMTNKGFEISLNTNNIHTSNFDWFSDFTLTCNKNKITELEIETPYTATNIVEQSYIEGYAANCIFAYKWAGLDSQGSPQAYMPDGSIVHRAVDIDDVDAMKYMGTATPPWYGALTNNLCYKNIEFSFMFIYNIGHKMRNDVNTKYYNRIGSDLHKDFDNRWRIVGDELTTDVPGYTAIADVSSDYTIYQYADINVLDASYAKLRDISITYNFPKHICRNLQCANIKVRMSASNILTFTANKEGIDPEAFYLKTGIRSNKYTPSYSVGLTINF